MIKLLFAFLWWFALVSLTVSGCLIVFVFIHDRLACWEQRRWDRDRERHIVECERREFERTRIEVQVFAHTYEEIHALPTTRGDWLR